MRTHLPVCTRVEAYYTHYATPCLSLIGGATSALGSHWHADAVPSLPFIPLSAQNSTASFCHFDPHRHVSLRLCTRTRSYLYTAHITNSIHTLLPGSYLADIYIVYINNYVNDIILHKL